MEQKQKFGLLGEKLSHSFSKEIHERMSSHPYHLIEVPRSQFFDYMTAAPFQAINVTIPYKQSVLPFLDELDESVELVGACNCIINRNHHMKGYNTDIFGIEKTFEKYGVDLKGKKVAILGNGGAMKAFQAYCRKKGAREVLVVYYKPASETIDYQTLKDQHSDTQILINATPVGMSPNLDQSPLDLEGFDQLEFVFDAIYNPLETPILHQARNKEIRYSNGLLMLVEQARKAHELFFDRKYPDSLSTKILLSLLLEQTNLILIGMPSSGKSTLGYMLAEYLDRPWVDTDTLIETRSSMSIPSIFESEGEAGFRARERDVVKELAHLHGHVISLGGGTILDPENVKQLQKNGLLIFLDRPLSDLISKDKNRPLLKRGIETLYRERYPLYLKSADLVIENNQDLENSLYKVIEQLLKKQTFKRFLNTSEV